MKRQRWFVFVIMVCVTGVGAQVTREPLSPATIEGVSVTGTTEVSSVEVVLSRPTAPRVLKLTNPDRLVLELENTRPGTQPLRTVVNRGCIKEVRIGEEDHTLPFTRVVLDVLPPQDYKVTQNGKRVMVILAGTRSAISAPLSAKAPLPQSEGAHAHAMTVGGASLDPPASGQNGELYKTVTPPKSVAFDPREVSTGRQQDLATDENTRSIQAAGADVDPPPADPLGTQPVPPQRNPVGMQPIPALLNALPLQVFSIAPLLAPLSATVAAPEQIPTDPPSDAQPPSPARAGSESAPSAVAQHAVAESKPSDGTFLVADTNDVHSSPRTDASKITDDKLNHSNPSNDTFVIGPGDVLSISVWKEPDITRSLPVRSDGIISLPLIGEVQASGRTPRQLGEAITKSLQTYISEPEVTVIVQEIKSRTYNVLGQVTKPGSYVLSNSATVLDAIAKAGGFRDFAKKKSMYVLRRESDGKEARIPFNYNNVIKGKNPEQNVTLRPGDTIVVP